MNKRGRYKAKGRRRLVARTMAILLVSHREAVSFLRERARFGPRPPVNPYRAVRQIERMFAQNECHKNGIVTRLLSGRNGPEQVWSLRLAEAQENSVRFRKVRP